MSDWESMSREELIEVLQEQERKTAALVQTVKAKKETWDKTLADLQEELEDAKNRNAGLEAALKDRNEEVTRVTRTLESMIAVTDKRGAATQDDRARMEELEQRIAALHEGSQLQKRDFEEKAKDFKDQIQKEQLNARVLTQKIKDLEEQLKVANERAFDAESRLGRLQKAHTTMVAERNRTQFAHSNLHSKKAAAAASTANSATAEEDDWLKDMNEIDQLGSELANLDVDIDLDFDLDAELSKPTTPVMSPKESPKDKEASSEITFKKEKSKDKSSSPKKEKREKEPFKSASLSSVPDAKASTPIKKSTPPSVAAAPQSATKKTPHVSALAGLTPPSPVGAAAKKAAPVKRVETNWDELDDMLNSI